MKDEGTRAGNAQQDSELVTSQAGRPATPGAVSRTSRLAAVSSMPVQRKPSDGASAQSADQGHGGSRDTWAADASTDAALRGTEVPSSGGAPVDPGIAGKVEQATGQKIGDVRVHTGEASAQASQALSARAFTTGQNIHLGAGESTSDGRLMAHELAHTIQQTQGRKVTSDVSQPSDPLEAEADRVAEAAVSGATAEVSAPAGAAATPDPSQQIEKLLGPGGDVSEAFRIFCTLAPADQATRAASLGMRLRTRMARNLQHAAITGPKERASLRVLFDNTPENEISNLQRWVAIRFNLTVGKTTDSTGAAWDKNGLRHCWDVLGVLPPSHVEDNADLSSLTRYRSGDIEGWASDDGEAAIGYGRNHDLDNTVETGAFTDPGDPMRGTNVFDATVRHEIGHRVDAKVGGPGYTATDNGGGWQTWDGSDGMADRMVAASGGNISAWPDAGQKKAIIDCLQGIIDDRVPGAINRRLGALPFCANHASDAAHKTNLDNIKADDAVRALRVCFSDSGPWGTATGGVVLGDRIYQEAYDWPQWVSYKHEARSRKVSTYQFRAPGEWFAEAYAAYYQPPGAKGALLAGRDDATKAWFDANVDPDGGRGPTTPAP